MQEEYSRSFGEMKRMFGDVTNEGREKQTAKKKKKKYWMKKTQQMKNDFNEKNAKN